MSNKPTIEDYFRSVPESVVKNPIFSDEDGTWFAYGHIDPTQMVIDIYTVDTFHQGTESDLLVNAEDVQYCYAKLVGIDTSDPDWEDEVQFVMCKPGEDDAFPVTVWNY